ncbi:hypothetical protein SLA2020_331320 [Shorea laevis]
MQIGSWLREIDLSVISMKNFKMVLSHKFINRLLPFTFMEDWHILFIDNSRCHKVPLQQLPTKGVVLMSMKVIRAVDWKCDHVVKSILGEVKDVTQFIHNLR